MARSQHSPSGSVRASAAAAAAARKGGTAEAGSWCGCLRAARYHSSARASVTPGSPSGRDASAASSRNAAPPGSTSAARRSPCRDSTPLAHALAPRLDATRSAPSRAALRTGDSRVRAAPAEKTEASVIAIASPRRGIHGDTRRLAALGGRATSSITIHPAHPTVVEATINVPRPARGGCAPGCRPLAWAPRGSSANPGYPVARDPVGPPQFASCFFGPFDTPSGTNPESAMGRLTEPAAMPLPGRADPRPGHLHRQHREAVSPSDEHRLR